MTLARERPDKGERASLLHASADVAAVASVSAVARRRERERELIEENRTPVSRPLRPRKT